MAEKKEPLNLKLTDKQLCEAVNDQKAIIGLRLQSLDIAREIGSLEVGIWDRMHKIFPEIKGIRFSVNWITGEITEAVADC